jgi:hypothetical protein
MVHAFSFLARNPSMASVNKSAVIYTIRIAGEKTIAKIGIKKVPMTLIIVIELTKIIAFLLFILTTFFILSNLKLKN